MLKKVDSKAAAAESTGGIAFPPARPELLVQFSPDGLRWGCVQGENGNLGKGASRRARAGRV